MKSKLAGLVRKLERNCPVCRNYLVTEDREPCAADQCGRCGAVHAVFIREEIVTGDGNGGLVEVSA